MIDYRKQSLVWTDWYSADEASKFRKNREAGTRTRISLEAISLTTENWT